MQIDKRHLIWLTILLPTQPKVIILTLSVCGSALVLHTLYVEQCLNMAVSFHVPFHVQYVALCAHILSACFLGNSLVDLPIVSHNLMFCRWDMQTPSMPLCFFFLSLPVYQQTGKQMIILWTHYSAWSSYHNQPSRVSNLGSAKLCSVHNVAFVSVLLCFFDMCVREASQKRKRKRKKETEKEGEGKREGLSAHICTPVSGDILPVWNKTSLWAGQYSGNTVNNS